MHNPVPPGNSVQPADANLYGKHYNIRPPYPSSSNQFSYFQADQQIRPQREIPPPPYYDRPHFGQKMEGGHYYGDQDNIRRPRHEVADGWGYSRPPFHGSMHPENEKGCPPMYSGMSCERNRPPNHGWGFPPLPAHHRNHIPSRPSCDGGVPVGVRAPGYWRPRWALLCLMWNYDRCETFFGPNDSGLCKIPRNSLMWNTFWVAS